MTTRNIGKALAAAVILAACGGAQETPEVQGEEINLLSEQLVMSTLWFQSSDEARQIFEQSYDLAYLRLRENMRKVEDGRSVAVILDIDETVLDNSPYEARLVHEGENFSSGSWGEWVSEAQADVLPGAREFLRKAAEEGVTIFYVSNRNESLLEPTLQNLRELELPNAEEDFVLLKSTTSDKTERRESIKERYHVVLLVGDQMGDFAEEYEAFLQEPELRDSLNQHFVLLPNPMYGGFEAKALDGAVDVPPREKAAMRKQALDQKR